MQNTLLIIYFFPVHFLSMVMMDTFHALLDEKCVTMCYYVLLCVTTVLLWNFVIIFIFNWPTAHLGTACLMKYAAVV